MEGDASPRVSREQPREDPEKEEYRVPTLNIQPDRPREPPWFPKRRSSSMSGRRASLQRIPDRQWWKFHLRPWDDDQEQDWWFAGTAIPLLAATLGPLANVLSIAALVTDWRMCLIDNVDPSTCPWNGDPSVILSDLSGHVYKDARWCYWLNAVSLILGFVGNLFLLFNFTNRIRYIIALPVTIFLWYLATAILIAITISVDVHVPPTRPQQTYTQGFCYFLGHYAEHFSLTDSQRTLILQTMMFFLWLAGGAAVFSKVESDNGLDLFDWSYVNALYFCDVTILTVGFGDLYPTSNAGRGLVFPYSVGGIIMLGLMISSITKFVSEIGADNVLQKHVERSRSRTIGRAVTSSLELEERERAELELAAGIRPTISGPFDPIDRSNTALRIVDNKVDAKHKANYGHGLRRVATNPIQGLRIARKPRLLLLREERDRFVQMRKIQRSTMKWKRWYALTISVIAFGILWCVGAVIFWQAEQRSQGITYFQSLYLCYVSLLTIGYGDLAPKSNAGRPFFVVWSLVAVPTMTILVADMGDTIISNFKQGTASLADFTVLPKEGIWHAVLARNPWLLSWLTSRRARRAARARLAHGFEAGPEEAPPTLDALAAQEDQGKPTDAELARRLAQAIRRTANDLRADPPRSYSYEEWVEYTQLIRFSAGKGEMAEEEEEEGLIEWDWIGEDSPMMAQESEAEFVLDRLCESMGRYIRRLTPTVGASDSTPRKRLREKGFERGLPSVDGSVERVGRRDRHDEDDDEEEDVVRRKRQDEEEESIRHHIPIDAEVDSQD
ncbi:hypothetical protein MBLNU459_g8042t2 [Dothideomycetes sp. NU459]